jgi:hypothetical protein
MNHSRSTLIICSDFSEVPKCQWRFPRSVHHGTMQVSMTSEGITQRTDCGRGLNSGIREVRECDFVRNPLKIQNVSLRSRDGSTSIYSRRKTEYCFMVESQKLFPLHYPRWENLATIGVSWSGIPGFMIPDVNYYA